MSIIINNYNYGAFLNCALDSVLNQKYGSIEAIAVDDGSTDASCSVLSRYVNDCIIVRKTNGGQASAMNAGFAVSRGEWVLFLDADDALFEDAIANLITHVSALPKHLSMSKLHAPLLAADTDGQVSNRRVPYQPLAEGDLRPALLRWGPESYVCSPNSGNLWHRSFLAAVMPIPVKQYRISADAYLFTLSPLFGYTGRLEQPVGMYRLHSTNSYWQDGLSAHHLRTEMLRYAQRANALKMFAKAGGYDADDRCWKLGNRYYLAKIFILQKLQRRAVSLCLLFASIRASFIAPISSAKKVAWGVWFLAIWLAPRRLTYSIAQPFLNLRTRM